MSMLKQILERFENRLKSLIRRVFWPIVGLLILHTAWLCYLWYIVLMAGDIENQQTLFQRQMVSLGWISCIIVLGISTGVDRKAD